MPIKIALILSVFLQFGAAVIALSLVKRTRNNVAWWLISTGFLLMAIRRFIEILLVFESPSLLATGLLSSWMAVAISVVMLISLIFIRRIFNIQKQIEELRKQNESRVLSAILKTEEKDRLEFSKELHDGLGPLLSSVKLAVSAVRDGSDEDGEIIGNAEHLIDESILTLKEISSRLSPHVLNSFGLERALKSYFSKIVGGDAPRIHLNSELGGKRFAFNVEVVVYRVVSELISNTMNHAGALNVYIDLMHEDRELLLRYMDDGSGFDEAKTRTGSARTGVFQHPVAGQIAERLHGPVYPTWRRSPGDGPHQHRTPWNPLTCCWWMTISSSGKE
ncbi:MAG: histidine kinase [Bacteroidales bacterium]